MSCHISSRSSPTLNPPPEDIDEMREMDIDVIEFPSSTCEHDLDCATCCRINLVILASVVTFAVGVGKDDKNERSESSGVSKVAFWSGRSGIYW